MPRMCLVGPKSFMANFNRSFRVKIFKKLTNEEPYVTLDKTDTEEQSDKDRGDVASKESGLQLVVNIRGESESATDEDE